MNIGNTHGAASSVNHAIRVICDEPKSMPHTYARSSSIKYNNSNDRRVYLLTYCCIKRSMPQLSLIRWIVVLSFDSRRRIRIHSRDPLEFTLSPRQAGKHFCSNLTHRVVCLDTDFVFFCTAGRCRMTMSTLLLWIIAFMRYIWCDSICCSNRHNNFTADYVQW